MLLVVGVGVACSCGDIGGCDDVGGGGVVVVALMLVVVVVVVVHRW